MMEPHFFFVLFFCSLAFGCTMGAYFTTAEYRIRHMEPLVTGTCHCPFCGHKLAVYHQIPIISWLFLRGRCHYCHRPIPVRYPLIEGSFLLFYGLSFILFRKSPLFLILIWAAFVSAVLAVRCRNCLPGLLKGLLLFLAYHIVYGSVILCVYAALGLFP